MALAAAVSPFVEQSIGGFNAREDLFAVLQQGGLFRQRFIFAGNQAGLVDLISLEAVEVHLLQVIPLLGQQTVQLSLNLVISLVGLVKALADGSDLRVVVAVHQTDVVVRIQQRLVVILPVDVGQAAAGLLQLGEGDQLSR